jgi:hypothetical protein
VLLAKRRSALLLSWLRLSRLLGLRALNAGPAELLPLACIFLRECKRNRALPQFVLSHL